MLKKISLFRFLSVSLIVFCHLLVSVFVAEAGVAKYAGEPLCYEQAPHVAVVSTPVFKRVAAKNDHIKVRYVGGDCGYCLSAFHLHNSSTGFYKSIFSGDISSCEFSNTFVLFTLRGPPAKNVMA